MGTLQRSEIEQIVDSIDYPNYKFQVTEHEGGSLWVHGIRSEYNPETGNTERYKTMEWLIWDEADESQLLYIIFNMVKFEETENLPRKFLYKKEPVFLTQSR